MRRIILAVVITAFAVSTAAAQSCESKAVSAEGKPLSGAAKTSFVKKCKQDACEGKAVSADGKALAGAAKNSSMKNTLRRLPGERRPRPFPLLAFYRPIWSLRV
jgi:hypothetical protein